MDKYEYKLKLEQIKSFIKSKDYQKAVQIADEINWRKVKSVSTLYMIGELYEKTMRLEESQEIFLLAYDRSPVGRNIIYRLTHVAIKLGNLEEAKEYYEEFLEIAPHDNMKYVLKYEIAKLKGAPVVELISILEEFKDREYTEEWAFELAYLYHKSGNGQKCVEVCDELVLWFGEGKYVERALELKMIYQPLNKLQEDKYRQFKQRQEGIVEVSPMDELLSGEIVRETVKIPSIQSDAGRFNTVNLQAELAKSMQQIIDATQRETVQDTMNNIKKMVGEVPQLQEGIQAATTDSATEQEPEEINEPEIPEPSLNINFKGILSEEYDGQISLRVPEAPTQDLQITGQMSIEDILAEWEKTKEAARIAIAEAEQRKLESEKAKALQEAEDIMVRLSDTMPLNMELPEVELPQAYEEPEEDYVPVDEEVQAEEEATLDAGEVFGEEEALDEEEASDEEEAMDAGEVFEEDTLDEEEVLDEVEEVLDAGEVFAEEETLDEVEVLDEEEALDEEEVFEEDTLDEEEVLNEEEVSAEEEVKVEEKALEDEIIKKQMYEQERIAQQIRQEHILEQEITLDHAITEEKPIARLNDAQREVFTYFTLIGGMEKQICQALEGVKQRKSPMTSASGNLAIIGGKGSGKTVLATDFIKVYQDISNHFGGAVGKISAAILNEKEPKHILSAVEGGFLVIERAGDLSQKTIDELAILMEQNTSGVLVIIEDDKAGMEKALSKNPRFAQKFTERIHIPVFTSDELVAFAKAYAKEQKCMIEDMAVLAVYNNISHIQRLDEATTLEEVKEIIDGAIANAKKGGLKKLFSGKRNTQDGYIILKEKDFPE